MSSTPSMPLGPDGAPLTRRQRRALERAQEEAQRARTGQVPVQQQGQVPPQGQAHQRPSQSASATWKPPATSMPVVRKPAAQARAQGGAGAAAGSAVSAPSASSAGAAVAWKPVPRHDQRQAGAPLERRTPPAARPAPEARPVPEARPAAAWAAQPSPATATPAAGASRHPMEPDDPAPQAPPVPKAPQALEPAAATGPQKAIGAALGRRPRGLLAIALAGVVVLAMVLVPLAVKNLGMRGEQGQASAQALETVLSGDDPLEDVVEIAGRPGVVPVVSLKGALTPATSLHEDLLVEGTGRTVSQGDAVLLSISTFSGLDGRNTTGTETGASLRTVMLDESLGEELGKAIDGKTEGSRVVLRAPHEETVGLTTELTVIDILPTVATGEDREPTGGMPSVTFDNSGAARISVQGLSVPSSSSITTLIQGRGPQVGKDDLLIARYSIVNWSTGQVSGTPTYGSTVLPRSIDMRNTLAGVSQLLVDVPVGSRVVLALPADQARGEDAVAVVIDVLAIASRDDAPANGSATESTAPTASPAASPTAASATASPAATATLGQEGP